MVLRIRNLKLGLRFIVPNFQRKYMRINTALVIALCFCGFGSSPLRGQTTAVASVQLDGSFCYVDTCPSPIPITINATDTESSLASVAPTLPPDPLFGGIFATASSNYGSLDAHALSTLGYFEGQNFASASASFSDTVETFGAPTTGTLQAIFTITGGHVGDSEGGASGSYQLGPSGGGFVGNNPHGPYIVSIPFTLGDSFTLSGQIEVHASDVAAFDPQTGEGDARADLTVTQLAFFDDSGQQVSGFGYATTGTGNGYALLGATEVPEPFTALLLVTAVTCLTASRRLRVKVSCMRYRVP